VILLLRHLLSIAALPFVVAVGIPVWVARQNGVELSAGSEPIQIMSLIGGSILMGIGLLLFASSLQRFATEGKGTLAPWDPPRILVLRGPYRYVRNPMISGIVFILFGEALALRSEPHLIWALTFAALNCVYIPLFEEPQLERRFGAEYTEYSRHVPRLVPRLRPWRPET
jgi:protein-S-isoprenylcysteine O-methyltransferase Ste14